ncbi:hypothetical protein FI667_g826, partial [Globisporangium splendens]
MHQHSASSCLLRIRPTLFVPSPSKNPIAVPRTFKQWQYANFGVIDRKWKLGEVRCDEPNRLQACSIRRAFVLAYTTETAPFVVGFDAAGVVVEVGLDVSDFQVGDESLFTYGKAAAGERAVVLGGSSSCGVFGIQVTKAVGANVIATSRVCNLERRKD